MLIYVILVFDMQYPGAKVAFVHAMYRGKI